MGRGASKIGGGAGGGVKEVIYGNTKFTISQGNSANTFFLVISNANGGGVTTKHKIAYAKDPNKARVYLGPSLGYIDFKSDVKMAALLKTATKS